MANTSGFSVDIPCRPVISGKVRADKVTVAGVVATKVQLDMIRRSGFIPIVITDVSKKDNQ
jgi:hypothetical protein